MTSLKPLGKITEDWSMDYEKKLMIRKYHICGELVSECLINPENENLLKEAVSHLLSFVLSIPCSVRTYSAIKKSKEGNYASNIREKLKIENMLKLLYLLLTTHPNKKMVEYAKKLGIKFGTVKTHNGNAVVIDNPHKVALLLSELYERTGNVAYSMGLRMRFPEEKVVGLEKIKEEEGIESDEIDELLSESE